MNQDTSAQVLPLELAANERARFEEFMRRQLGVPKLDPGLVVAALSRKYPGIAARLDEEGQGVSIRFNTVPELPAGPQPGAPSDTAGAQRLREMHAALDSDLVCLLEHPSNREQRGAFTGWRDAILAELSAGHDAAALSADPLQRDRAFYALRKLEDFARVARLVSLLNPSLQREYRRLATSLDAASMALRVRVGEALFQMGGADGGSVFKVAVHDLDRLRMTLIAALERFTPLGPTDSDDWGDGPASRGALERELAVKGQGELRVLLRPESMSRLLDVLLAQVANAKPETLRELAATAPVELVQLKRLRAVASQLLEASGASASASAPLSAFVQALHLFIEAFARPGSGTRLLDLAVPFPFASGQLGRSSTVAMSTVHQLIGLRSRLSTELEALHGDPDFDPLRWSVPVVLDRVLYDVSRALDLHLLGSGSTAATSEEARAALYGQVLWAWLDSEQEDSEDATKKPGVAAWVRREPASTYRLAGMGGHGVKERLRSLVEQLATALAPERKHVCDTDFLQEQRSLEEEWRALARQLVRSTSADRLAMLAWTDELYPVEGDSQDGLDEVPQVPGDARVQLGRIALSLEQQGGHVASDLAAPAESARALGAADTEASELRKRLSEAESRWRAAEAQLEKYRTELERARASLDDLSLKLVQGAAPGAGENRVAASRPRPARGNGKAPRRKGTP